MAPNISDRVEKKWMSRQLRHFSSLKTIAGVQKFQKTLLKLLDEKEPISRSLTVGDATIDQITEIFGLNISRIGWVPYEETYDVPKFLTYSLKLLKKALYDMRSEAYNHIAIDYLIVSCMAKHRDVLSRRLADDLNSTSTAVLEQSELPINSLHNQATEIAEPSHIIPTTSLVVSESTFRPLSIKVIPEMPLSVQVNKGSQVWDVNGIADWAIGYGDRAVLEDGVVLLAIEAKKTGKVSNGEPQLLAYLATIRQLRIQAGKKNVMTQGFVSDGENYRFICIRNNGTVMKSVYYDISLDGALKSVFNFLLAMLNTVVESSPNTSHTKQGLEQDEKTENFDGGVFVQVFEDIEIDGIPKPTIYYDEMEEDEWSDVPLPEEE